MRLLKTFLTIFVSLSAISYADNTSPKCTEDANDVVLTIVSKYKKTEADKFKLSLTSSERDEKGNETFRIYSPETDANYDIYYYQNGNSQCHFKKAEASYMTN
jgi:hypothetical protein